MGRRRKTNPVLSVGAAFGSPPLLTEMVLVPDPVADDVMSGFSPPPLFADGTVASSVLFSVGQGHDQAGTDGITLDAVSLAGVGGPIDIVRVPAATPGGAIQPGGLHDEPVIAVASDPLITFPSAPSRVPVTKRKGKKEPVWGEKRVMSLSAMTQLPR